MAEITIEELQARVKQLEADNASLKESNNKLCHENAEKKKAYTDLEDKYKATLSDAEREKLEREKRDKERDELIKGYQRKESISNTKLSLVAMGYSEELANQKAEAIADGDFAKANEVEKKFLEGIEQKHKEEMLKGTPKPPTGGKGDPNITKEQFDNMSYRELADLKEKSPEVYEKLMNE